MLKRATATAAALAFSLALTVAGCGQIFGPTAGVSADKLEQEIFKRVNEHRHGQGRPPVVWSESIAEVCRRHSRDMAGGMIPFGHDGCGDRFDQLSALLPWRLIAEVVGYSGSPQDVVKAWIASPEHGGYLVGDYELAGVGVAKPASGAAFYVTQIFIKRM